MAIHRVGKEFHEVRLIGLSTDIKPIHHGAGSKFLESDTSLIFLFTGSEWIPYSSDITDFDGGLF